MAHRTSPLHLVPAGREAAAKPHAQLSTHPRRLAARDSAGLRAVLKLAGHWDLNREQIATLLGVPVRTLARWKRELADGGEVAPLGRDGVDRVSYLLGIWKALEILFPESSARLHWLRTPNSGSAFNGQAPLQRMLQGGVADLAYVREHLDGLRG